jgi:type I restriction enzyme R subunit
VPALAAIFASTALSGMTTKQFSYALKSKLLGSWCLIIIGTEGSARIHEPTFRQLVGNGMVTKARIIKDLGNTATHNAKAVPPQNAVNAVRELFHLSYWLVGTYACGEKPDPAVGLSADKLPRPSNVTVTTLKQLQQEAEKRAAEAEKARAEEASKRRESDEARAAVEAELAATKAEYAAVKASNFQFMAQAHDFGEAATRDLFIDLLLTEAGWDPDGTDVREYPVTGMPNQTGQGFVDYVLWGDDGKPLAVVEAKHTRREPREGQRQAELYANCLEKRFGQRPVIFNTNGYEHWIWDDFNHPPREIQGFLTKGELQRAIQGRTRRRTLAAMPINPDIVDRHYQTRVIRRVCEAFEKDAQRRALLVMWRRVRGRPAPS